MVPRLLLVARSDAARGLECAAAAATAVAPPVVALEATVEAGEIIFVPAGCGTAAQLEPAIAITQN